VNARKERHALKEQIKQQQKLLREEKKKYKQLHRQVDKMAKLMAETDEEEEEEEDEEEEEEETESEEESESEESEEEEESETDDEEVPIEKRKSSLEVRCAARAHRRRSDISGFSGVPDPRLSFQKRVKKHEGRLAALKKGNYLLKAQVDRVKDDLVKQREASLSLQEDLDSVLAELG